MLSADDAQRLEACLAEGGVAVFPADTVYGLACDPQNAAAVLRLYELKRRPADRPAAVMWFSLERAVDALPELAGAELEALRRLLPGPVTLLLPNRDCRFPLASGPDPGTLGLRVPRLPRAAAALGALSGPVLQSSANLSGDGEARSLGEVPASLRAGADLVLDGGALPGIASTVIDLRDWARAGRWAVVRDGALARDAVARALGETR